MSSLSLTHNFGASGRISPDSGMRVALSPSMNSIHSNHSSGASSGGSGVGGRGAEAGAGAGAGMGDAGGGGECNGAALVEHADIITLTNYVKTFRESLSKFKRIFHPESRALACDKSETLRVQGHERLGQVLRILRNILEKYPPIQSTELLMAAGTMIQQVKGHNYEDEKSDLTEFFEAIDQLALAFSSRVSEYLMGDIHDTPVGTKAKLSTENLVDISEDTGSLTPTECDDRFLRLQEGIDLALHRAKVWSKYAKDVIGYIEKRAHLEAEHARNLAKLAQTTRPLLKEESFLPFQSVYCTALDQDLENSNASLATCALLLGHKFLEPLTSRRNEHEKARKQIKQEWSRELKRMHEAGNNLRKARSVYIQRHSDYERAKSAIKAFEGLSLSEWDQNKVDRKRRTEDEAGIRAMEAETGYRAAVEEANERGLLLEGVKKELLQQVRELIYQCDQTMKAVTVSYFQLQHTISAPAPVQFQTLCESSRLYEPGSQYNEFVKRLPQPAHRSPPQHTTYSFEPFLYREDEVDGKRHRLKSLSDSESLSDSDPGERRGSPKDVPPSSGDELDNELETDPDANNSGLGYSPSKKSPPSSPISRAASSHRFKKLKTPSRCRECEAYVYFQGLECAECGLSSHRKCLESLTIKCGHKRLPRKMTTFGVSLSAHDDRKPSVPYIVAKCVDCIDNHGISIKGLYRVSGVKSKVEHLCQSFENGADLVDLSDVQPNVVANVLKLYLRQLPEPLLTFRLYHEFIAVAKAFPGSVKEQNFEDRTDTFSLDSQTCEELGESTRSSRQVIHELKKVVAKLPSAHYLTLAFLMHHLKRVADQRQENNMPSSNLGIVFGPTLLRMSAEGGPLALSVLVDTVHQTRVIELLISFAEEVFGPPIEVDSNGEIAAASRSSSVLKSASASHLTRAGKAVDFSSLSSQICGQKTDTKKIRNSSSSYSTSAVITLSGQRVNTSSVADANKPSITELRRQFFTSPTSPLHSTATSSCPVSGTETEPAALSLLSSAVTSSTITVSAQQLRRTISSSTAESDQQTRNSNTTTTPASTSSSSNSSVTRSASSSQAFHIVPNEDHREPKYV